MNTDLLVSALQSAAPFQLGSHQAIIRIDTQKLALGQGCLVVQTLQVLLVDVGYLLIGRLLSRDCPGIHIELDRREGLEEGLDDL